MSELGPELPNMVQVVTDRGDSFEVYLYHPSGAGFRVASYRYKQAADAAAERLLCIVTAWMMS